MWRGDDRQDREGVRQLGQRIEAAGFDSIWVGEHISFYVPIFESLTTLSFLAGVTERVRLGTSVYLLPLRHPTTTAKTTSVLDVLSGGRLIFGVTRKGVAVLPISEVPRDRCGCPATSGGMGALIAVLHR